MLGQPIPCQVTKLSVDAAAALFMPMRHERGAEATLLHGGMHPGVVVLRRARDACCGTLAMLHAASCLPMKTPSVYATSQTKSDYSLTVQLTALY